MADLATTNGSIAPGGISPGTVARQEFGAQQLARSGEVAMSAVQAREIATVQARHIVARSQPRDLDDVALRLRAECKRPGFARVARYSKPVGGKPIEGPSIRFVEAALRLMGNVHVETQIIAEEPARRIVRIAVVDLETNTTYEQEVVVEKVVERKGLKKGQHALRERLNSYGDTVYLVEATDDDLLNKQGALVSKAIRTQGLRLIPGDIVEEAQAICIAVQENEDAKDPAAERKRLVEAFAGNAVRPQDLKAYLGHDLDVITAREMVDLRAVFAALKDGETTWADILEARKAAREDAMQAPEAKTPQQKPAAPTSATPPGAAAPKETPAADAPPAPAAGAPEAKPEPTPAAAAPPADPLDPLRAALAAAKTRGECLRVTKLVASLPPDLQFSGKALYDARVRELTPKA